MLVSIRIPIGLVFAAAVACGSSSVQQPDPHHATSKPTVDLDLRDAPIYDALRALAQQAQVNLDVDSGLTGTVTINVRSAPWDDVLATIAKDHNLRVAVTGPVVHVSDGSKPAAPEHTFTGTPMKVRFDDTPIRDAVKVIADVAKIQIAVDDGIDVGITLHLRNVPWDLALDHLVRKYELRLVRDGDRLRIRKR